MTTAPEPRHEDFVSAITNDNTDGLATAREIIAAAAAHDGVSPVSDQAMLAVAQGQRELLLFGERAAVGIVGDGEIDVVVRPEYRRRGIGTAALTELVSRGSGSTSALRAWAHGENPAATALLTKAGFAPVRLLLKMALDPALLPSGDVEPASLTAPAGFQLRAFASDSAIASADAEAWVRVNAAAFADHPEQGRMTVADFELITQEDWFDAADLFLLITDGSADQAVEPAGSTWIKTTGSECELYAIGVHPDHAGHGLGRYLLDVTLTRMAQHRPELVTLYVDGGNTRAVQMYEAAGFTVVSRSQQWERRAK